IRRVLDASGRLLRVFAGELLVVLVQGLARLPQTVCDLLDAAGEPRALAVGLVLGAINDLTDGLLCGLRHPLRCRLLDSRRATRSPGGGRTHRRRLHRIRGSHRLTGHPCASFQGVVAVVTHYMYRVRKDDIPYIKIEAMEEVELPGWRTKSVRSAAE